jgi:hypothetical protein
MVRFVCLKPHEHFFSYLGAVTITGDRTANFWPMLGVQGLWAGRDLYRATPTTTRDLGLYGLIRKTGTYVPQWNSNPWRKDHQIIAPHALTTAPRRRVMVRYIFTIFICKLIIKPLSFNNKTVKHFLQTAHQLLCLIITRKTFPFHKHLITRSEVPLR